MSSSVASRVFHTDGQGCPSYEIPHFSPREVEQEGGIHSETLRPLRLCVTQTISFRENAADLGHRLMTERLFRRTSRVSPKRKPSANVKHFRQSRGCRFDCLIGIHPGITFRPQGQSDPEETDDQPPHDRGDPLLYGGDDFLLLSRSQVLVLCGGSTVYVREFCESAHDRNCGPSDARHDEETSDPQLLSQHHTSQTDGPD